MRFKVISFDADGTLVTQRFSQVVWGECIPRLYAESRGMDLERARSEVFSEYGSVGEDRPEWYSIDYWLGRLGIEGKDRLIRQSLGFIELYPEVEEVVRTLNEDYALVVTSNAPSEFLDLELKAIAHNFDRIFSAPSNFQMVKRDPNFYRRICSIMGVGVEEVVHVGDRWNDDMVSPSKAGLTAFHLNRDGEGDGGMTVSDLEEFRRRLVALELKGP
jgi:FMN phosphatase YigB (HAD superfamily)